jgi:hypothetical protein
MLNFGRTNAEGKRAKPAVTGRMAVAADYGGAGQRKALFRPDNMNNALLCIGRTDIFYAKCWSIRLQGRQLRRTFGVGNRQFSA